MPSNELPEDPPALTLERLLATVGGGALELYTAPRGLDVPVRGVTIFDTREPGLPPGQVLLAVETEPHSAAAADLVREAGKSATTAVVFRHDRSAGPGPGPALHAAAAESGTAVLLRTAWVNWAQLVGVLRAGLAAAGVPADPGIASVPPGDLDGLADAIAALVGGAVTIEDVESRVLAYSSTDGAVDEIRRLTILGRRVPQWRVAAMREDGFFRAVWSSGDVVHRPAEGDIPERLVVAVRAGGEVLGSIWVAAAGGRPLPPTAADALRAAARAAVPHVMHHRFHRAGQVHLVQDAARALLEGRGSAEALATRTALPPDRPCAVLALDTEPGDGTGDGTDAVRGRLQDLLALHCTGPEQQAVVVPTGPRSALVLLAGLAADRATAADQVTRLGKALVQQLSTTVGPGVRVGLGDVAPRLDRAPDSRRTAGLALRALRFSGADRACATVADLAEAVALVQVRDALRHVDPPAGTPVARLAAYDAAHRDPALVDTLRAYLDHFGDVPRASDALGVHPNTFRYRLRRIREVGRIDLRDPDARLLAHLQLRLMDRRDG
ncbi:DNA-binding protein [Streptomyces mashuensis]|uniref:DNA-binding protein n=1 Tax=Streptomyces mashuensis TaxID=33904 RepID=A0A919B7T3_9ACTN|nr:PucR family transcriptional regulator [Streptomyces mashuensis]GHF67496.1 DNA-binding protein [Streptomyces mashuensis]